MNFPQHEKLQQFREQLETLMEYAEYRGISESKMKEEFCDMYEIDLEELKNEREYMAKEYQELAKV
jgi:hypothetical protein